MARLFFQEGAEHLFQIFDATLSKAVPNLMAGTGHVVVYPGEGYKRAFGSPKWGYQLSRNSMAVSSPVDSKVVGTRTGIPDLAQTYIQTESCPCDQFRGPNQSM